MAETGRSAEDARRRSLRPLKRLFPYILRYRKLVVGALLSLTAAAADDADAADGRAPHDRQRLFRLRFRLHRQLFLDAGGDRRGPRAGLGLPLLFRHHARRARGGRPAPRRLCPYDQPVAGLLRHGAVRRDRLAADRGYHADQVGRRRNRLDGAAQHHPGPRRGRHDGGDQPETVEPGDRRHPADRAAAGRLRPLGAAQIARRAGHARRRHRLCQRAHRRDAHNAGLHQ